ncbi:MAG TPA: DUF2975 domain-containing protein [Allosphingosinicella sp.]|jgi:hypothetical protein
MPALDTRALSWSRALLKLLLVLNIALAALVAGSILFSIVYEEAVVEHFRGRAIGGDAAAFVFGFRLFMILGLFMFPLVHLIAARLLAVVETVRAGDPFVPANAERLTTIAWALLGTQILHLGFGAMAGWLSRENARIDWTFSFTGWLAVLLLFVLARVFAHGAAMRDELEATV